MGSKCSTEETTPPMTPVGCASPVVPSVCRIFYIYSYSLPEHLYMSYFHK